MIHPDTELRFVSPAVGFGVFATAAIPRGTLLWVACHFDRVLTATEVDGMGADYRAVLERYAYVDSAGDYNLCWDLARRLNHSCEPSMRGLGQQFDIAVRDIAAGEQITCEYGVLNLSGSLRCACGAPTCRGTVRGDDAMRLWDAWDAEILASLPRARHVPQPLLPFARAAVPFLALGRRQRALPEHAPRLCGALRPKMSTSRTTHGRFVRHDHRHDDVACLASSAGCRPWCADTGRPSFS